MDPEDDEDSDEEPDSIDPDNMDSGELDASNSDDDQDPELSLTNNRRRMGKRYGQVDSATTGTKFEQRVAYVKARDGCSASEAASRARKENPILYESYLKSGLAKGSNTYWAKVQERMLLGDSQTVAEQKVLHAFGKTLATPDINKSADVVDFMRITDSIMKQHPGLSRVEAMRKARLRNPRAFGRYQNVR
jgi:hypothetical protein